jgi:hypothetical protein
MDKQYRGAWLIGVLLLLGVLFRVSQSDADELTQEEVIRIAFEARRSFEHIIQLWKDNEFAQLYEFGTFASQVDISPEGFERYMGYASRSLQCCWQTVQNIESIVDTSNRVYVKARVGFKNKEFLILRGQNRFVARGFAEEETLTFLLQHEKQQWRIDLFRILALSGVPVEIPGYPPLLFRRPY